MLRSDGWSPACLWSRPDRASTTTPSLMEGRRAHVRLSAETLFQGCSNSGQRDEHRHRQVSTRNRTVPRRPLRKLSRQRIRLKRMRVDCIVSKHAQLAGAAGNPYAREVLFMVSSGSALQEVVIETTIEPYGNLPSSSKPGSTWRRMPISITPTPCQKTFVNGDFTVSHGGRRLTRPHGWCTKGGVVTREDTVGAASRAGEWCNNHSPVMQRRWLPF